MARRKRASMREGPLADLFRSTVEPEEPPRCPRTSSTAPRTRPASTDEESPSRALRGARRRAEPTSPLRPSGPCRPSPRRADPERVHAYRVEERDRACPSPRSGSHGSSTTTHPSPTRRSTAATTRPDRAAAARPAPHSPVIRVVGVGGAGVNAVNRMVEAQIPGVEFMAINTDLQSLQQSTADVTVHLGSGVARGLGAGSDPELGYKAAFEEQDKIKRLLKGSDMVFITAGAGGGTGTGAAPVVARLARDVGALAVGIVTRPVPLRGHPPRRSRPRRASRRSAPRSTR